MGFLEERYPPMSILDANWQHRIFATTCVWTYLPSIFSASEHSLSPDIWRQIMYVHRLSVAAFLGTYGAQSSVPILSNQYT